MSQDPEHPSASRGGGPSDLFDKLDSLMQKHQGRARAAQAQGVPMLTEPVETPAPSRPGGIPVLEDAVDAAAAAAPLSGPLAQARRQLQVALYLRLRQRLDQELEAALADGLRLGEVAVDPAFTRVTQELRAILPMVVRESVDQVLGPAMFESLVRVNAPDSDSSS